MSQQDCSANMSGDQRPMSVQAGEELYNAHILALAGDMPRAGRLAHPQAAADVESRLCGSRMHVELSLTKEARIADFAHETEACALGQAAASIVARTIVGRPAAELRAVSARMRAMLEEGGPPPAGVWRSLRLLAGVRDYPMRHGSVMLVFRGVEACLQQILDQPSKPVEENMGQK